jgi:arginine N-succinyltransferase
MYPELFKPEVHSELLPPFDEKGQSPLWEAIGRKFLNMDYHDADILSQSNKEFILNLYPAEIIYETLLPVEARNAIGKVGAKTLPVKNMLEKIGMKYINQVDPFDGGPHYRAKVENISLIKNLWHGRILKGESSDSHFRPCLIAFKYSQFPFCAIYSRVKVQKDKTAILDRKTLEHFPNLMNAQVNLIFL